jgi:hypothetical protein
MNIVDKLLEYRDTRKSEVFDNIDSENLTVIVTEILSWLKLERKREIWIEQGRKTSLKPLVLNMNYPWCVDLANILQGKNAFSEVFGINGNCVSFKENVSSEYIQEARLLAYEKYNPKMIIG